MIALNSHRFLMMQHNFSILSKNYFEDPLAML